MNYEINRDTFAIVPFDNVTKVYEGDEEFIIDSTPYKVMEKSCEYFGSSINGRLTGTKKILGTIYKAPIVVEEYSNIVFFPTKSVFSEYDTSWISLKNIKKYESYDKKSTLVFFNNNKSIILDIPYLSFENQILRATRLESIIRQRQNM